jgi:hypothetical protein
MKEIIAEALLVAWPRSAMKRALGAFITCGILPAMPSVDDLRCT